MYMDKGITEYLDDLAAKKPAPGGGSAAALSASIGVALMSMVANYTVGNKNYKGSEERVADILVKVQNARRQFQELVDGDVEAYNKLSRAMKDLKGKTDELQEAYKEALEPPFETAKLAGECMKLCRELAECGNKNLITDTAIAAIMLEGAFFSAKFNVYVNLKCIKDMSYVGSIHGILSPLEKEMPALKEEILELCEEVISK